MHLHDHFGGAFLCIQHLLHFHHAQLDQVCRRTLHGCVDGGALGTSPALAVGGLDFRQVQAATENGFHIALGFGLRAGVVHIALDPGKAGEIALDVIFGSGVVDAEISRQTVGAHAINQTEVDHLGIAALLGTHLVYRQTKDLGSRGAVHIQPFVESAQQGFVTAQVGHDAQLDLAVVGTGDQAPGRGHKGLAHAPPLRRADRDVLQIGVVARQAPGHRHCLRVMGVYPAGARVGQLRQLVGVGAFEFGQTPVLQNFGRQWEIFSQFF